MVKEIFRPTKSKVFITIGLFIGTVIAAFFIGGYCITAYGDSVETCEQALLGVTFPSSLILDVWLGMEFLSLGFIVFYLLLQTTFYYCLVSLISFFAKNSFKKTNDIARNS